MDYNSCSGIRVKCKASTTDNICLSCLNELALAVIDTSNPRDASPFEQILVNHSFDYISAFLLGYPARLGCSKADLTITQDETLIEGSISLV